MVRSEGAESGVLLDEASALRSASSGWPLAAKPGDWISFTVRPHASAAFPNKERPVQAGRLSNAKAGCRWRIEEAELLSALTSQPPPPLPVSPTHPLSAVTTLPFPFRPPPPSFSFPTSPRRPVSPTRPSYGHGCPCRLAHLPSASIEGTPMANQAAFPPSSSVRLCSTSH